MSIGIRSAFNTSANVAIATNIVPATVGLTSPIAAGQTQKFRAWIPFSVGATGGIRALLVVPAAGVLFITSYRLNNTVAPSATIAEQVASGTAFTNAAANAGNHWLEIEGVVVNGANKGTIDIQLAQNTSDALTLTTLRGATLEVLSL